MNTNGSHQDEVLDLARRMLKMEGTIENQERELTRAIRDLSGNVNRMATNFESFLKVASTAVPLKAVFWMFIIVTLCVTGIKAADKFLDKGVVPGIVGE
jgi:hypothetical protein